MAKLRRVGNAFAGVADAMNRIIPIMLQDKLARERAVLDDERTDTRQREAAYRSAELGQIEKLLTGDIGPEAFSPETQARLPLRSLRPSPTKLLTPLLDDVAGADNLAKLGSADVTRAQAGQRLSRAGYDPLGDQGSLSQFRTEFTPGTEDTLPSSRQLPAARPEIEQLMAARNSQRDAIVAELERAADEKLALEKGGAYNRVMGTEQATAEAFPAVQARDLASGQQANALEVERQTALSPVLTQRAVDTAVGTARGTLPIELEKAREVARINQLYGEWSPEIVSRRLQFERDKAIQSRDIERSGKVMEMADAVASIQQPLQELVDLSAQVNTSARPQPLAAAGAYTQLDTNAHLLQTKSRALAMQVVNSMGWNKGATSENDVNAIVALLPTAYDSKEQAAIKIADFNKRIYGGYAAIANAPAGLDPLARINVTRQALGLPNWRPEDFAAGQAPPALPRRDPFAAEDARRYGTQR